VLVTAIGITVLVTLPTGMSIFGLIVALALQGIVAIVFWQRLPLLARDRAGKLVARFLFPSLHLDR